MVDALSPKLCEFNGSNDPSRRRDGAACSNSIVQLGKSRCSDASHFEARELRFLRLHANGKQLRGETKAAERYASGLSFLASVSTGYLRPLRCSAIDRRTSTCAIGAKNAVTRK
jgi:hypothetical protein